MTEIIELYWPFIAWFIIGCMCGASAENWARRSYISRNSEDEDPAP